MAEIVSGADDRSRALHSALANGGARMFPRRPDRPTSAGRRGRGSHRPLSAGRAGGARPERRGSVHALHRHAGLACRSHAGLDAAGRDARRRPMHLPCPGASASRRILRLLLLGGAEATTTPGDGSSPACFGSTSPPGSTRSSALCAKSHSGNAADRATTCPPAPAAEAMRRPPPDWPGMGPEVACDAGPGAAPALSG